MRPLASHVGRLTWRVEELRHRLAELVKLGERLELDRRQLEEELSEEQRAATVAEAELAYGTYVAGLVERRAKLDASIAEVGQGVAQGRDELRQASSVLEKLELASDPAARRRKLGRDPDETALALAHRPRLLQDRR